MNFLHDKNSRDGVMHQVKLL